MAVIAREATSLLAPRSLTHELNRHIPELRAIRSRRALERSSLFARIGDEVERVTRGMEYGSGSRREAASAPGFLRVAAWNIERGRQLDSIVTYAAEHPLLRRADVLLVPEVDIGMARSGNRNVAAELAAALGFDYVFGNSYLCLDGGNSTDWEGKDQRQPNSLGLHGNAILSRFPINRAENVSLPITKDKFHSSEKRLGHKKALWAELETPFGALPVAVVHLDSGASPAQRGLQMKALVARLEERGLGQRALVGGDFNTTTYDIKNPFRMVWNLLLKYARGGFPHALYHYAYPQKLYERPVFDALDRLGLDYGADFNEPGAGTSRYEVEDPHAQAKVLEYMPRFILQYLRRKLRPWNGVAPFKLDWFAASGLRGLGAGEATDGDGTASIAPTVIERPSLGDTRLSDHDIILADVLPAGPAGVPSR